MPWSTLFSRESLHRWRWPLAIFGPVAVVVLQVRSSQQAPLYKFLLVIAVAKWIGGLRPAILCTVLSLSLAGWFFLDPVGSFSLTSSSVTELAYFLLVCCAMLTFEHKLITAKRRLAQALAARDHFLAIAGHELKTPLTALKLQMDAMRRALEKSGSSVAPTNMLQRLDSQMAALQRMQEMTEELLDVSRLDSGQVKLHPELCDLSQLIPEVIERFQPVALKSGSSIVFVEAEHPVKGYWDSLRIEQVLVNLVTNAIKYGAGGPIEIRVGRGDSSAFFTVKDCGPGVPLEDRTRIFERFQRLDNGEAKTAGLGLGLWIVRQIVEQCEGKIDVTNAPSGGSVFSVTLPRCTDKKTSYSGAHFKEFTLYDRGREVHPRSRPR